MGMILWLLIVITFSPQMNCSSVSVSTDIDQSANFDNLQTYGWMATSEKKKKGRIKDTHTLAQIRTAIDQQFKLKGYQNVTENPDFFVASHASVVRTGHSSHTSPHGSSRGSYGYKEGSLVIDILNPGTGNLMWRGNGKIIVGAKDDPETGAKQINEVVQSILEEFPSKRKK